MTPGARIQAAIEILDGVIAAARTQGAAADTIIARYFADRRYAGSKDRRAVRDLVYLAIRALGELPVSGRAAMLAVTPAADRDLLFTGEGHAPAPIKAGEPIAATGVAPAWLLERLEASDIDAAAVGAMVTQRAPLDLRVNALNATVEEVKRKLADAEAIPGLPFGLRLSGGADVTTLAGTAEIQDAGSQFVAMAAGAAPDMVVVDLCAGGGGKTLALAADMANRGTILACDVGRDRLSKLPPRAKRAGATIIEPRLLDPGKEAAQLEDWQGRADVVLIDAPCSGTGTWRRNPETRWRLTPDRIDAVRRSQKHLLAIGAALAKPGGRLCYAVCSLLDDEGAAQVDAFVATHPAWEVEKPSIPVGTPRGHGVRLTPAKESTDGFFIATLRAPW